MKNFLAVLIVMLSSSFLYAQGNGLDRSKFQLCSSANVPAISKTSLNLFGKTEVPAKAKTVVKLPVYQAGDVYQNSNGVYKRKASDDGEDWTWNGQTWSRPTPIAQQQFYYQQPQFYYQQPMAMPYMGGGGGNCSGGR